MPTAALLHSSESGHSICQLVGRLPPDRVWVPVNDLPTALNTLALLQEEISVHFSARHVNDTI